MFKVSVIVPVFDVEKYLRQCLDSIVSQSLKDIEIICVDDGSTDGSLNILKEYESKDSRVKVICQQNNGVSSARNRGLEIAQGEYIYFADSDDYLESDSLDKLYSLSKDKDLDLLIFKLVNFDEKGNMDYSYSDMPFLSEIEKETFSYLDFKDNVFNVDVTVYTKFFKRQLIGKKRFAENLIFEDNAFYADYIFDAERIYFHDECLYNRRIRKNSLISRKSKNYCDLFKIHEIIIDELKNKGVYEEFKEMYFMRKVDSIYYRFTLIDSKYRKGYYDKMRQDFLEQKDEYENGLDLKKINSYHKSIYEGVIESSNIDEIESCMKISRLKHDHEDLKRENRKLKRKKRKLKRLNRSLRSSRSWKITGPLRKLKK